MTIKNKAVKPRNPVARSPLMRKGGAHQTGESAQRQHKRQALQYQLDDWRDELEFEREQTALRENLIDPSGDEVFFRLQVCFAERDPGSGPG